MTHDRFILAILAVAAAAPGCTSSLPDPGDDDGSGSAVTTGGGGATAGDEGTTFDHDNSGPSAWELVERLETEGPPKFTSHMHSCTKVRYKTLGRVLASLGINPAASGPTPSDPPTAGDLYAGGFNALGGPSFANRIRESASITTSGASREFDIFAAGADQVIANVPNLERCKVNGVGALLFDGNQCRVDGITCILGTPATIDHVELCNLAVTSASTPELGKRIAVASLLAAAYTCE